LKSLVSFPSSFLLDVLDLVVVDQILIGFSSFWCSICSFCFVKPEP
jgi:hypothetical protein